MARDAARASSSTPKDREAALALVRAGLALLDDGASSATRKRAIDARRALAGAPAEGEGHGFEYRQIAAGLKRAARALPAAHAMIEQRLLGDGEDPEVVDAAAPILSRRLVMRMLWASLVVIDERLVRATSIACEPPYAAIYQRFADGHLVIDGAIAELLLETGALDVRRDPRKLPSYERKALQQKIRARLRAPRKR